MTETLNASSKKIWRMEGGTWTLSWLCLSEVFVPDCPAAGHRVPITGRTSSVVVTVAGSRLDRIWCEER
jgi:hypothetical protein